MYLAILSEEEKELFLGLAYNLAAIDGEYSDEERTMIAGYCQEMQIEFDEERAVKSVDELLGRIKAISDDRTKKIIVFEAIGLAMADGKYYENERKLVDKMEKEFGIEAGFSEKCESIINEYLVFQKKTNQLILG